MFRDIGNTLKKKKEFYNKIGTKDIKIEETVRDFFKKEFGGEDIFPFALSHDIKNNGLTIVASNKIIANELILKLTELSDFLKNRGIHLDRIQVR